MTSLKDIEQKAIHAVQYGEKLRPMRDWFLLLSITGLLVLASALWNAWTFIQIERGVRTGTSATTTPLMNENALQKVETVFENRRSEEARYRTQYQFVDPS